MQKAVKRVLVAEGERSHVYAYPGLRRVRKVVKDEPKEDRSQVEWWPVQNVRTTFYAHKIADALFPGHFLVYSFARRKIARGTEHAPAFLEAPLLETSARHQAYVKTFYHNRFAEERGQAKRPLGEDEKQHEVAANGAEVRALWRQMLDAGVSVNNTAVNIDFVNGKPFFFDVHVINPMRVQRHLEGNSSVSARKKEQILGWLAKYERARMEEKVCRLRSK